MNNETRPLKLLLIDDDKDDCHFFEDGLKEINLPAELTVCKSCTKFTEVADEEHRPDVVFLDLNMPGVNGKECLLQIRELEYMNAVPVIIFSTSCQLRDVNETYACGANMYVQKPASFTLLVQVLDKLLHLNWNRFLKDRDRSQFVFTNR